MKKILIFCLIFFFSQNVFAIEKSVNVSAVVNDGTSEYSNPPKIQITSPSYLDEIGSVEYIQNGSSIAIDFLITDPENANVDFTITGERTDGGSSGLGVFSIENGTNISTSDGGYLDQFVFLAGAPGVGEILITAIDGQTISTKKITVYIY